MECGFPGDFRSPGGSDAEDSAYHAGDLGLIPGKENGYPLQQKQDWELTVAQMMNSLLPNSDLN